MRTEKLNDEWFDYDSSLSTVTDFYGAEANAHVLTTRSTSPSESIHCGAEPSSGSSTTTTTDTHSFTSQEDEHTSEGIVALQMRMYNTGTFA